MRVPICQLDVFATCWRAGERVRLHGSCVFFLAGHLELGHLP